MKFSFCIVCLVIFAFVGNAQEKELNPNTPYEDFSLAYATLDAATLSNVYTEDGVLLNLYDGSNPNSVKGVTNIKAYFEAFFSRSKETGQTLKLEFKITDRQKEENIIYDNGFYKLSSKLPNQPERVGYGKLSTVLVHDQGRWKFKVDSNTNTTKEEFENAEVGAIPQPN
ncbi:YybH family protein [Flagellimonas meridianipacifica]|uniref:Ketosteroid isomerase-like protein n=1 Tax=Flagellimonas meridianipacifica TaxID=1080225 RepID=A0A2T0MB86_9FLAO|nr:hypothetical protein [Allomuricauda pacifica]PRX54759.1 ketosteroid isomerase-like protein [Allomuricauda pacifica]